MPSPTLVLVDLDGPLTRLFPGDGWLAVSAQVRELATERGGPALAAALGEEPDHVQCLRIIGDQAPDLLLDLAGLCTRLELEAAESARPAAGAVDFLERVLAVAQVAVVTNNDPRVAAAVLDRARPGLSGRLMGVYGRSADRVDDLKPRPDLLLRALDDAGVDAGDAVFLGDSVSDVEAGRAAGARVVGVAEDADRREALLAAGAVAAVATVADLSPEVVPT